MQLDNVDYTYIFEWRPCNRPLRVKKERKKRNSEMWHVTYLPRPPTLRQSCRVGWVPEVVNRVKFHQNRHSTKMHRFQRSCLMFFEAVRRTPVLYTARSFLSQLRTPLLRLWV